MSCRQFATTLRRSWTRRAGCSARRSYSTELKEGVGEEPQLNFEHAEQQPQIPLHELPEGMRRVVGLKERRNRFNKLKDHFEGLGSTQARDNTWQPHYSLHRPEHPSHLTLSALLAAGAHLGHSKTLINPAFTPYAYGTRAGITLIDLDATLPLLRRAAALVRAVAADDGTVVFVGTRADLKEPVRFAAERMGENAYYVGEKWLPGTLTNRVQLFGADVSLTQRVIPDLVVFLNPIPNLHAIRECALAHVPTVGIIDSNVDPRIVMYPIPANDESPRTAELVSGVLSIAGKEGNELRKQEERRQEEIASRQKFSTSGHADPTVDKDNMETTPSL